MLHILRCPYYCCDGVPTSPLEACCVNYTYNNARSYWWISLVAIAIIAVTAGLISLLICCLCVKGGHVFGEFLKISFFITNPIVFIGRAFYKPPTDEPLTQNTPYMISPNYRVGFSNYPTQMASNYEIGSLSDKPPSYDKIVFKTSTSESTSPVQVETPLSTVSLSVSK
jgi:hypothetical protein